MRAFSVLYPSLVVVLYFPQLLCVWDGVTVGADEMVSGISR